MSVGHEMIINPSVLLLDEPTSGASSTVFSMGMCTSACTSVCMVHGVPYVDGWFVCKFGLFIDVLIDGYKLFDHDYACHAIGCNKERHMWGCNKLHAYLHDRLL